MKENVVSDLVCWGGDIQIDEHVQREIMNHRSLKHSNIIKFKEDSLTQLISSSPKHYRVVICSLPIQGRCSPALAISAFVSASAGTVSLPTSLFAAGIDDNILAKAIKTNVATIQALKSSFAPTS